MVLLDANILIYSHREELPEYARLGHWMQRLLSGSEPFGVPDPCLTAFLRLVSSSGVFHPPTDTDTAFAAVKALRSNLRFVDAHPGPRHMEIFEHLCRDARATGDLIGDAWLAALAIEQGAEWISTDGDFGRFHGLRWTNPLTGKP